MPKKRNAGTASTAAISTIAGMGSVHVLAQVAQHTTGGAAAELVQLALNGGGMTLLAWLLIFQARMHAAEIARTHQERAQLVDRLMSAVLDKEDEKGRKK